MKTKSNVIVLPENTKGTDIIVGDIHGSLSLLKQSVENLSPDDRLFIVGDLIDKGEDSAGVLDYLIDMQNKASYAIFSIQGNHEKTFLDYAYTRLYPEKFTIDKIRHTKESSERNEGSWVFDIELDKIKQYYRFIKKLPYIYLVNGKYPFNVVHADLSPAIPYLALKTLRVTPGVKSFYLHPYNLKYLLWARNSDLPDIAYPIMERTNDTTIVTYCGHTPFDGVRAKTNHVNIDVGAYYYGGLLEVHHHKNSCVIRKNIKSFPESVAKLYDNLQNQIEQHLLMNKAKREKILRFSAKSGVYESDYDSSDSDTSKESSSSYEFSSDSSADSCSDDQAENACRFA